MSISAATRIHEPHSRSVVKPLRIELRIPDFTPSWVGPGRHHGEVCFGSEEGKLLFSDGEGKPTFSPILISADSPEAINGVAFIGENQIAVSTRGEVVLLTTTVPMSAHTRRAVLPCGAHGVIATSDGRLVAPLGTTGFMTVRPGDDVQQQLVVSHATNRILNYYQAVSLRSPEGRDAVAFAVRHAGIAAAEATEAEHWAPIRMFEFSGLDVVDVCSLGTEFDPAAIAAIGKDGTLIFARNVFGDRMPVALKLDDIQGVAYRVFCFGDSIVVLTSVAIYYLEGLAGRFLGGEPVDQLPTPAASIGIEAVNANICGGNWLFVVMVDHVLRFDLNEFSDIRGNGDATAPLDPQANKLEWAAHRDPLEQLAVA